MLLLIAVTSIIACKADCQPKKESVWLSSTEIVGTWQRDSKEVGSGLLQNFKFSKNNTFVLNLGSDADDARDIIQLNGKYRLVKDSLFFTITSKKVVEGKIQIADGGISLNLFNISGKNVREIPEKDSKESPDPCYITRISKAHIKISQEQYYKIE